MAKKEFNTQEIDKFFTETENIVEAPTINTPATSASTEKTNIVRKTYYVRADQHKALKLKALQEDIDISSLIQKALDAFLNNKI
jgi:hypothetical protein